uniref:Uncharacterized protein n=1 Tax=Octopus bimaculoides TaxID=37653 RepID=A0A0L8GH71_OCTBM
MLDIKTVQSFVTLKVMKFSKFPNTYPKRYFRLFLEYSETYIFFYQHLFPRRLIPFGMLYKHLLRGFKTELLIKFNLNIRIISKIRNPKQ